MNFFTQLTTDIAALHAILGDVPDAGAVPGRVLGLGDTEVVALLESVARLEQSLAGVRLASAGVIASRSSRKAGHQGVAQRHGFRSATGLMQHITGNSRGDVARQLRVGEALFAHEQAGAGGAGDEAAGAGVAGAAGAAGVAGAGVVWHAPLSDALLAGHLSAAQHDAIMRGLGEPPQGDTRPDGTGPDTAMPGDTGLGEQVGDPALAAAQRAAWAGAWRVAAIELSVEAAHCTVEQLAQSARTIRDMLDPAGAEHRFLARYEARSFRMWTDADGLYHGRLVCDDESAAWLTGVIASVLRPRRGGPRFVDPAEHERAEQLLRDPRTNEQLAFDALLDMLRGGVLADPVSVHGTRQAGVRVVTVIDPDSNTRTTATSETGPGGTGPDSTGLSGAGLSGVASVCAETGVLFPAGVTDRMVCSNGVVPVSTDRVGNPLNVGRQHRLFTPKQRIALAVRDSGCRWPECDRPASYCEAHHIDAWENGGRTDIDRGILLCRFHHVQLHTNKWRITRTLVEQARYGSEAFVLHSPNGETTVLSRRLVQGYAWGNHRLPDRRILHTTQPPVPAGAVPTGAVPTEPAPTEAVPAGAVPAVPVPSRAVPGGAVPSRSVPAVPVPAEPAPSGPAPSGPVPSGPVPSGPVPSGSVPGGAVPVRACAHGPRP